MLEPSIHSTHNVFVSPFEGATGSRLKVSDFQYSGLLYVEHVQVTFGIALDSRPHP